jgi:hypothetical protein
MADNKEAAKPKKHQSLFKDRYGKPRRFGSGTWNNYELGQMLADEWANDLPKTAYQVFFAMIHFVSSYNYLDVRLKDLAERCHLSIGPVQRAMKIFERKRLIVRTTLPHRYSVWMLNPEFAWNARHDRHQQAIGNFKRLCHEADQREHERAKKKQDKQSIMEERDIMPMDFGYLDDIDEPNSFEETEPCALKSKAA